jgi:hypothetical protein
LVCEAIGTAATPGLLYQPRVIVKMIVEKQMECRFAEETKFSEKTCRSATFVHYKIPHDQTRVWTRAAAGGKPAINRLSYDAVQEEFTTGCKSAVERFWHMVNSATLKEHY